MSVFRHRAIKEPMEDPKKTAEETANQPGQTDEQNGQPAEGQEGADEVISISKKELEKFQKKAADFDGIIEKQRLEKLNKKTQPGDESDPIVVAKKAAEETVTKLLQQEGQERFQSNLSEAYKEFVTANPWVDADEVMTKISDEFTPTKVFGKEEIVKELEVTALRLFPEKYKEHLESQARAKVMAETLNNTAGSGGGGVAIPKAAGGQVVVTDEDRKLADKFFGGDVQRYLKYKKD